MRTEIDTKQIQDGEVLREDLNILTPGQAVVRKVSPGVGISETHSGVDDGTGDVILSSKSGNFGVDFSNKIKVSNETTSGNQFSIYDTLTFNVSDAVNIFRANIDFLWGHDSAANDIRVRAYLDGNQIGEEVRIEPKDQGGDQRIQNNILNYLTDLSVGSHTLSLRYRPSSNSRTSRMYRSIMEVWRVD